MKLEKILSPNVCIFLMALGGVLIIGSLVWDALYIPHTGLVSECTYETQHEENGPVCNKLHKMQNYGIKAFFIGGGLLFVFGIYASIKHEQEERRIKDERKM